MSALQWLQHFADRLLTMRIECVSLHFTCIVPAPHPPPCPTCLYCVGVCYLQCLCRTIEATRSRASGRRGARGSDVTTHTPPPPPHSQKEGSLGVGREDAAAWVSLSIIHAAIQPLRRMSLILQVIIRATIPDSADHSIASCVITCFIILSVVFGLCCFFSFLLLLHRCVNYICLSSDIPPPGDSC